MGGFGSGSWTRYGTRETVESLKRIEITHLKKLGILNTYHVGTLSWTRNGQPNGYINYTCTPDYIVLEFNFRRAKNDEWQPVKQQINFDMTSCNYGGVRYWLLCPQCQRRVGVLCAADKLFLCRHCYGVGYDSQNESSFDRLNNKKDKIAKRIFEDYNKGRGRVKKKWMHQKTFDRLYREYKRLDYHSMLVYDDIFTRLQRQLEGK